MLAAIEAWRPDIVELSALPVFADDDEALTVAQMDAVCALIGRARSLALCIAAQRGFRIPESLGLPSTLTRLTLFRLPAIDGSLLAGLTSLERLFVGPTKRGVTEPLPVEEWPRLTHLTVVRALVAHHAARTAPTISCVASPPRTPRAPRSSTSTFPGLAFRASCAAPRATRGEWKSRSTIR